MKLIYALWAAVALMALNFVATLFDLYWVWPWFDILMHGLGGVCVGMGGVAFWNMLGVRATKKPFALFLFVIGFVSIVGIGWEWFEYGLDTIAYNAVETLARRHQPGIGDTMADFFMDITGGLVTYLIVILYGKGIWRAY